MPARHPLRSARVARASLVLLCWLAVPASAADVSVTDPWISAAPPVARVNAGYLVLTNAGPRPLTLTAVESPRFARIELHRSAMQDGVNAMRRESAVTVEPGEVVVFEPGALHLMLFDAALPPEPGEMILLELVFAGGLRVPVQAEVRRAGSGAESHHH